MSAPHSLARFRQADTQPGQAFFGLRTGKVVGVDPRDHSVDVAFDDGSIILHVPLLEMWAGTDYGDRWLPQFLPVEPGDALTVGGDAVPWEGQRRDTRALVAFVEGHVGNPVVIGFFYPEVSQMMHAGFQRITRYLGETFSGVGLNGEHYLAFDAAGGAISLNRGLFEGPNVTANDYDRRSRPGGVFNITLYSAAGAKIDLDGTSGSITIHAEGHLLLDAEDHLLIASPGPVDIAGSPLTLSGLAGIYF